MTEPKRSAGSTCRDCGDPIEWAQTAAKKWMPLDPDPASGKTVFTGQPGNVVIRDGVAHVLGVGKSIEDGEVLRTPHFATCTERRAQRAIDPRDPESLRYPVVKPASQDAEIRCPFCGETTGVHMTGDPVKHRTDDYTCPLGTRGSWIEIDFWCEFGPEHYWRVILGFHKGQVLLGAAPTARSEHPEPY
jgi:hypothetical protein